MKLVEMITEAGVKFPMKITIKFDGKDGMADQTHYARRHLGLKVIKANQVGNDSMQYTIKNMMQLKVMKNVIRREKWQRIYENTLTENLTKPTGMDSKEWDKFVTNVNHIFGRLQQKGKKPQDIGAALVKTIQFIAKNRDF